MLINMFLEEVLVESIKLKVLTAEIEYHLDIQRKPL